MLKGEQNFTKKSNNPAKNAKNLDKHLGQHVDGKLLTYLSRFISVRTKFSVPLYANHQNHTIITSNGGLYNINIKEGGFIIFLR